MTIDYDLLRGVSYNNVDMVKETLISGENPNLNLQGGGIREYRKFKTLESGGKQ